MDCDICQRAHHPKRLPFFCAVDARNEIYDGRVANVKILAEAAELESRVTKRLLASDSHLATSDKDGSLRAYLENCISEEHKAKEMTERIMAAADKLRDDVAAARKEIQNRRASIARRKSELAAATRGAAARRDREIEETKAATRMDKYSWDREYGAMTQYRAALCMEVAKLYRLSRVKRGNPVRFEYKIGGIDIIDLYNMNNAQPELISASLAHITHLLWLTSHYLAIRLPAEITLPHNDYPRPTIFSLPSSYHHGDVAFPGTSQLPPDPRDRQFAHVPHPRPLFIDKPLSTLAKEDSALHNSFLEATCLLAYDIVWLCRTQGVPVGDNSSSSGHSLDDFSCMGRNLYTLLMNSSVQRNPQQIVDAVVTTSQPSNSDGSGPSGPAVLRMGLYSHGTAHTFLGSAAGNDLTRSFKMPSNIAKLVDRLKAKLLRENPAAAAPEWELLEDDAWTPDDALDDGVLVGDTPAGRGGGDQAAGAGGAGVPSHRFGIESYMSVATLRSGGNGEHDPRGPPPPPPISNGGGGAAVSGRDRQKEKGTSGWTKVKVR
ncbi:UV radiation resistance protein and autophagy-related subunit 14-domain-containing protein [Hypoxylon sp. FL1150]|nr:UV radiation resistance protein and autophagy-related subunit 14-domain-containing protein [Hypoxylon sp. FL1150]